MSVVVHALSEQSLLTYVKWLFMFGLCGVLALALRRQNHAYSATVQEGQAGLLRAAIVRGNVALALWVMLVLLMIYRDGERVVREGAAYPAAGTPVASAVSGVDESAPEDVPVSEDAISEGIAGAQEELADQYSGSYTPRTLDAQTLSHEASADTLKATYEDAFVSFMILRKCGMAGDAEFRRLYTGLSAELATLGEEASVAGNVMSAASGSYQILYSSAACDAGSLTPVKEGLESFLARRVPEVPATTTQSAPDSRLR